MARRNKSKTVQPIAGQFTGREIAMLVAASALALGSFGTTDPYVVLPMLFVSLVAFLYLCFSHSGRVAYRLASGLTIALILVFIGWRALAKTQPDKLTSAVEPLPPTNSQPISQPAPIPPSLDQNAKVLSALAAKVDGPMEQTISSAITFRKDMSNPADIRLSYPNDKSARARTDLMATAWLVKTTPGTMQADWNRYANDLALYSLIDLISGYESDWQNGPTKSGIRHTSPAKECTMIDGDEFHKRLSQIDNLFSEMVPSGFPLCMPPMTHIEILPNDHKAWIWKVEISNPICQIAFAMIGGGFIGGTKDIPNTLLREIDPNVQNFDGAFEISVRFFKTTIDDPKIVKYREWSNRLVKEVTGWFDGTFPEPN